MLNADDMPNYAAQEQLRKRKEAEAALARDFEPGLIPHPYAAPVGLVGTGWLAFLAGLVSFFWFPWQVGASGVVLGVGTVIAGVMWMGAINSE